jgi:hypothetical protein
MPNDSEATACVPASVNPDLFNPACVLPYGLRIEHIHQAMIDFIEFLGFINQQLHIKGLLRLESFLMPASFSSIVGEFANLTIPKYCPNLAKNKYHNGHPDLIPRGLFPDDAVRYSHDGVEIKGSRHDGGWQGHNPEAVWLMVFQFDSNTSNDTNRGMAPRPFRYRAVYAAKLENADWTFSGRSAASRRTITASVNESGTQKMKANWIYRDLGQ